MQEQKRSFYPKTISLQTSSFSSSVDSYHDEKMRLCSREWYETAIILQTESSSSSNHLFSYFQDDPCDPQLSNKSSFHARETQRPCLIQKTVAVNGPRGTDQSMLSQCELFFPRFLYFVVLREKNKVELVRWPLEGKELEEEKNWND